MGTLSKRSIEDFGADVKERIEGFRSSVGKKLDSVGSKHPVVTRSGTNMWVALAGLSFVGSLGLRFFGRAGAASAVASWVPTLLLLGLYDRLGTMAATQQHDRHDLH